MKPNIRRERGVAVIQPVGAVTIGVGDVALRQAVHEVFETGDRGIVIDLSAVTTMDSSGLGELVAGYAKAADRGVRLLLADAPRRVTEVLEMTRLLDTFEIYGTVSGAVDSFA